ncbi:retron St85 family RNA-directed DNA polymerase [Ahrensia marina]|uniref:retron St85 family RNA-directed DNA polymerase n=1 Tax=Ahrensia marina TaxID=1514904 RepID=UPI0006B43C14|nr:retron St85 family RNA-directed DNA polymerase [Ahrensia marina]
MSKIIRDLVLETGISASTLQVIINSAPESYKVFSIPKKTGGTRIIAQPSKQLKIIQRALIEVLLHDFPIHEAAKAYVKGSSIRVNADQHAGSQPIQKYDFSDFFPSITSSDWRKYCDHNQVNLSTADLHLCTKILFRRAHGERTLRLSIGAPTSPILSNILMFDFDKKISEKLAGDEVKYTRYADDLTFSAPKTGYLNAVPRALRECIQEIQFPTLKLNAKKTAKITAKHRRIVTGLTLANDGRVTIGRDKKRLIRSKVHKFKLGQLDRLALDKLTGELAYINAVEPEYISVLKRVYGDECISKITRNKPLRKYTPPSRNGS